MRKLKALFAFPYTSDLADYSGPPASETVGRPKERTSKRFASIYYLEGPQLANVARDPLKESKVPQLGAQNNNLTRSKWPASFQYLPFFD
jgi:hypothetical protein